MMEATLMLATIAERYRFTLAAEATAITLVIIF
jgi:hypothetical protein